MCEGPEVRCSQHTPHKSRPTCSMLLTAYACCVLPAPPCRAKNDLKAEKDPFKRAVLDGRQLALKVGTVSWSGHVGIRA